jgi:glycogen debranching enzyme
MLRYGPEVCGDLEAASRREWLQTNGIGGFASSTVAGLNTRRYHALLVAATTPPAGRRVLLSKVEETLVVGQRRFELSVNRYPGPVVHPAGHRFLQSFRMDPGPVWTYRIPDVPLELEKRVFLLEQRNAVVVEYTMLGSGSASALLELRPLIACRDFHSLTRRHDGFRGACVELLPGVLTVAGLYFEHRGETEWIRAGGDWYLNFEYGVERERGLDFQEDLFNPFASALSLQPGETAAMIASTEPAPRVVDRPKPKHAAEHFIVARGDGKTIIAGYPWFGDWGRDTMISLPGLTLAAGRYGDARAILLAFAGAADGGMLPNRFPDFGEQPEYNTADATLWFFEAARAYAEASGDREFLTRHLLPVFRDMIAWHHRGTRHGIRVDPADGLLACGEPGLQLTWMDAKVDGWVVTPRHGKPVEIQALWHNALCIMADISGETSFAEAAARARASFQQRFWNQAENCLFDVIEPGGSPDAAIRPNQVLAVSLPHPILDRNRWEPMLRTVERELLTPYGLRTLSPRDSRYRPIYTGGPRERDGAYHQGTVWPWLLGPFAEAWRKTFGGARDWFAALRDYQAGLGVGHIPEIFDGDPPHHPRGCFAQAWSLAALLQSANSEVKAQPEHE